MTARLLPRSLALAALTLMAGSAAMTVSAQTPAVPAGPSDAFYAHTVLRAVYFVS